MAIQQVRAHINGAWHTLTYNSATQQYEKTITAPNATSFNVNAGHYYPVEVEATNTAGTKTTVNDQSPNVGNSLKLRVLEKVKPTISITSPGSGAYVANARQPIVFQLRDEANGSGIDITSLALKIDSGSTIGHSASGMVCTQVTNGYNCTHTPPSALGQGSHSVTVNVSDNVAPATQASRSYIIDTIPPVLNVTAPSDGFITNKAVMVVQGTTNDATSTTVSISIKLNGADQGSVPVTSGSFSKSISLAEGNNTIVVTATDAAGLTTTVTINGVLDTTAPTISSVTITPNPVDAGETMIVAVKVSG